MTTKAVSEAAAPPISLFISPTGEAVTRAAYRRVMNSWPTHYDDLHIETGFGKTHVIASGPKNGMPVVFLHALFATATSWYRNVAALSDTYRVFCVDVIGEANESRPTRPIESMDGFLDWFVEVVDGLGLDTFHLVGNSYGGFTAAYYAMKLPRRVEKLVLIGPASTIHSMRPFLRHMFVPKGLYLMGPRLPGSQRAMRSAVDWMHAGLAPDPLWEPLFYQTLLHGRLINRVFPRVYEPEEMDQIEAPTLFVFGEREVVYGHLDKAIEAARSLLPGSRVVVIPEAHHITALAQPDAVNGTLLEFFAD